MGPTRFSIGKLGPQKERNPSETNIRRSITCQNIDIQQYQQKTDHEGKATNQEIKGFLKGHHLVTFSSPRRPSSLKGHHLGFLSSSCHLEQTVVAHLSAFSPGGADFLNTSALSSPILFSIIAVRGPNIFSSCCICNQRLNYTGHS